MSEPELAVVKPPKQRRSRESYERVLQAALLLLSENGFEGFTIQEVAARSNVSVGAIYERFGTKENVLRAAHARLMDEMSERYASEEGDPPQPGGSAVEAIRRSVFMVANSMDEYRILLRAFMHFGALDEVISGRGSIESIEIGRAFKKALAPYAKELRHSEPDVALDVAFRLVYSTLARQVMYGPVWESDVEIPWEQLTAELTDVCTAYLVKHSSARAGGRASGRRTLG